MISSLDMLPFDLPKGAIKSLANVTICFNQLSFIDSLKNDSHIFEWNFFIVVFGPQESNHLIHF